MVTIIQDTVYCISYFFLFLFYFCCVYVVLVFIEGDNTVLTTVIMILTFPFLISDLEEITIIILIILMEITVILIQIQQIRTI